MKLFEIELPLSMMVGNKKINLNMNWYRNVHYIVNNNAKQQFNIIVKRQLKASEVAPVEGSVALRYTITFPDKRKRDLTNVGAVIDKFFCDALVKAGIIQDDNATIVKEVSFKFAGVDKDCKAICEVWKV